MVIQLLPAFLLIYSVTFNLHYSAMLIFTTVTIFSGLLEDRQDVEAEFEEQNITAGVI